MVVRNTSLTKMDNQLELFVLRKGSTLVLAHNSLTAWYTSSMQATWATPAKPPTVTTP